MEVPMARRIKNKNRKLDIYCTCDPPDPKEKTVCGICGKLRKSNLGRVGREGIAPEARGFKDK